MPIIIMGHLAMVKLGLIGSEAKDNITIILESPGLLGEQVLLKVSIGLKPPETNPVKNNQVYARVT
jgi:hypothetical protein